MRGKVITYLQALFTTGITPAYAGKSTQCQYNTDRKEDHPRVCGEKNVKAFLAPEVVGSPPRMRGKGNGLNFCHAPGRITPAYAGKSMKK